MRNIDLMLVGWSRALLSKAGGGLLRRFSMFVDCLVAPSSPSRTRCVEEKNPRNVDTADNRLLGSKLTSDCVREGTSAWVEEPMVENVMGDTGEIGGSDGFTYRLSTRICSARSRSPGPRPVVGSRGTRPASSTLPDQVSALIWVHIVRHTPSAEDKILYGHNPILLLPAIFNVQYAHLMGGIDAFVLSKASPRPFGTLTRVRTCDKQCMTPATYLFIIDECSATLSYLHPIKFNVVIGGS